jgi:hypothetical protein
MNRQDGNRFCALMIGFAAITIGWFALETYAPDLADSLGDTSPWFYGPGTLILWGVISAVAFLILRLASRRAGDSEQPIIAPGEPRPGRLTLILRGEAARQLERDKVAGLTAGFSFTVAAWLVVLSYFPTRWVDAVGGQPPWLYSVASIVFWAIAANASYVVFRKARARTEANRDGTV